MPRPRTRAPAQESLPMLQEAARAAPYVGGSAEKKELARNAVPVKKRGAGQKAGVVFREAPSTKLVQLDYSAVEETTVDGAIVKVTAELRPSEREAFDAAGVRATLLGRGAIAVVVAPVVVAEAPTAEAKEEVARSVGPEEAIDAWFGGLSAPASDVEAARALAIHMLEQEKVS